MKYVILDNGRFKIPVIGSMMVLHSELAAGFAPPVTVIGSGHCNFGTTEDGPKINLFATPVSKSQPSFKPTLDDARAIIEEVFALEPHVWVFVEGESPYLWKKQDERDRLLAPRPTARN